MTESILATTSNEHEYKRNKFNQDTLDKVIEAISEGKMTEEQAVMDALSIMSDDIKKVSERLIRSGTVSSADMKKYRNKYVKNAEKPSVIEFTGARDFVEKYLKKHNLEVNILGTIDDRNLICSTRKKNFDMLADFDKAEEDYKNKTAKWKIWGIWVFWDYKKTIFFLILMKNPDSQIRHHYSIIFLIDRG